MSLTQNAPTKNFLGHLLLAFLAPLALPEQGIAAEPHNWTLVTDGAAWQARDSQGELVYNDRLWLFGGWFQSYEAPPRDVWSSADGRHWEQVTKAAPWLHSDLSMSITFKQRMWFMGGWYNGRLEGHSASNAVWSSTDGKHWTQQTAAAPWAARLWFSAVVY